MSNRLGVGMGVPKIRDAGAWPPWDKGVVDPLETSYSPLVLHTKFRRCRSNRLGVRRVTKILGTGGAWLTPRNVLLPICITVPNSIILGQNRTSVIVEIRQKKN